MPWLVDRLLFPLLAVLSPDASRRLGLTPIDDERIDECLKLARGRVLDVGCGSNRLVARHPAGGVGVDVHPWPGVDVIARAHSLPFGDGSFETVTMAAMLNHVPAGERHAALLEARRVLQPDGQLLVTMIGRRIGRVTHWLRRAYDPDQTERGMGEHEDPGLDDAEVRRLLAAAGFVVVRRKRFVWRLNSLYVARPAPEGTPAGAPPRGAW